MRTCICIALLTFLGWSAADAATTRVRIETSVGNIVVQMEPARSPLTVKNFLQYATEGFYDGTIFHRVVNGFVIQGGGYDRDLVLKPVHAAVPNESGNGLSNRRGTIAMARTNDPHSADAQFYINLADNVTLDPKPTRWGYAVFGEVVEGLDVVDEIGHRATAARGEFGDMPVEPVVITRVVVLPGGAT
jgi:peptidyl-prolyl cis-trans isomerase A (cyclophilin A)/peptidyl-prolyl cis-trans isomerase B (cyclophilin B)